MFKFIKSILRLIVLLVIAAIMFITYAHYIEPKLLTTNELSFEFQQLHLEDESLKIAVFSDTHFSQYYTLSDFDKAINAMNEQNPDIVFFVGDLIDHFDKYTGDTISVSESLLKIEATIGKFAVFGNHDYGGGSERHYQDIMEDGGFNVLINDIYRLNQHNINIIGIDDVLIGFGDITTAANLEENALNILLCHEPDIIDEMLDYNIDLMIAGHTHGKQVNLPFPFMDDTFLPGYGEKYIKGVYQFENKRETQLFVTSGLGTTKLPLRFMVIPEVVSIEITN